jgi:hypothetical protein
MGFTDRHISDNAAISPHKVLGSMGYDAAFARVLYVQSTHSNAHDGGQSGSRGRPLATLAYAVNSQALNENDIIVVGPGHVETLATAAAIAFETAGVRVIGVGYGTARPTITLGTYTACDINIGAANCSMENLRFLVGIDSLVNIIDVDDTDFTVQNCEFREGASMQADTFIDVNGGGANACDRFRCVGCKFYSYTADADSAIELGEIATDVEIIGNTIIGDFASACIHNPTSYILTFLLIKDNVLTNLQSGDHAIELVSACTGVIADNVVNSSLSAIATKTGIDQGACHCTENYGHDAAAADSGVLNPAVDS